jgi:hypothetical protein
MRPNAAGELERECGLASPAVKPMMAPPSGRDDEGPVHRFDSRRRLARIAPVSTNRIPRLLASAKPARGANQKRTAGRS